MKIIFIFLVLQLVNVILSTIRSILTIKGGKLVASFINAGYFAFYTIVLIYTVADFPLWVKVAITFGTNLIGVFIVKLIEQKMRKDRLWKIEGTADYNTVNTENLINELTCNDISFNYIDIEKYMIVNCYCETQTDSKIVKELFDRYNVKYFASETKIM
jgi:hypothetical protein